MEVNALIWRGKKLILQLDKKDILSVAWKETGDNALWKM